MHVALIIDNERLEREGAMLHRLTTGLAKRDVEITGVLPELLPEEQPHADRGVIEASTILTTRMRVPLWMRRARAHKLAAELDRSTPDLLHAIGERSWTVGLEVARALDVPVTLDVWSAELVQRAPQTGAASRVAGFTCPTEPIADALRRQVPSDLVSLVPLGVEVPPQARAMLEHPDDSMALAIIGSGHDTAAHKAMLTGLSRLTKELPQIQACVELRGPHEHEIWRHARRLDLLGHISAIFDAAWHRQLMTGCDVLVVPERFGQMRSLILQAMATGMPVVASDDPYLDMLIPDETAVIVGQPDPDEWAAQLRLVLTDGRLRGRLCRSARSWVGRRHPAEGQIDKLATVFEQVLSGGAHTFADAGL